MINSTFSCPPLSAGCRIGNLLVPNDNYCKFEDWLIPILDQMLLEQNTEVGSWWFRIFLSFFHRHLAWTTASFIILTCVIDLSMQGTRWTPSKMIHRLGKEINNPESVYYWAYKVCPDLICWTLLSFTLWINKDLLSKVSHQVANNYCNAKLAGFAWCLLNVPLHFVSEQHSSVQSCSDRWLPRRHALLPLVQEPRAHFRHRGR